MKTCSKCSREKALDLFSKNSGGKFGRHSVCKVCMYAAAKERYKPEQRAASNAAYYQLNKEAVLKRTAEWTKANREKASASCRKWRAENPEKQRQATLDWRAKNPEAQSAHWSANDFTRRAKGYSSKRSDIREAIIACKEAYRVGDKYLDVYTMQLIDEPTIDHVVPLSLGGRNELENFVLTTRENNSSKGNQNLIAFLWRMAVRRDHALGTPKRAAE